MFDAANRNSGNTNKIKSSKFVSPLSPKSITVLLTVSVSFLFVGLMIMSVAYYSPIAAYAKSKKSHNETLSESSDKNNAPLKELGQSANKEESVNNPSSATDNNNNNNPPSSESSDKNNAPLKELGQSNLGKIKLPPGGIRVNESDLGGIKLPPGGGKIKIPPGGVLENPPDENAPPNNPTTPPP
ncbi:MAG TPA: hypothetical protein VE089_08665, partial [Nitrososphaeraceae archaeon]|nr:hypothetical protein [Nitrososphaeraceae archaeon]